MNTPNAATPASSPDIPPDVLPHLQTGETVLAVFSSDVDARQRFRTTWVVLTDRRLLSLSTDPSESPQAWPLAEIERFKTRDRAGLGTLEVLGADRRLAVWHYTFRHGPSVLVLIDRFDERRSGREDRPTEIEEPEPPEAEAQEPPPNTMALFRLWQFARPHSHWIAVAFVLSFAAQFAGIVPSTLVTPILDEILFPYQAQGETESLAPAAAENATTEPARVQPFGNVVWYLLAMFGMYVASWFLSWAQGVLLARVSERISADLRNRTYAHLQKLSLEYFGGKRTGDLMSR
ncbi:MAG TPA: ABC transporter transmembrane domain-containing protein, partial [Planctomycetaceae bacterium]|nr:ABC transporter transmembrane domain-containing protein [Planctomycetaceae bacterium]